MTKKIKPKITPKLTRGSSILIEHTNQLGAVVVEQDSEYFMAGLKK